MTPWRLEWLVQKCARWIYSADANHDQHHPKDERLWFTPLVLTPQNPDGSNPQISIEDAREVFASLEKRQLLDRRTLSIKDTGGTAGSVEVSIVDRNRSKDWNLLISKRGFWNMQASPVVYYFVGKRWAWLILLFALGAFIGQFLQDFATDVYKASLGKWFEN